VADHSTWTGTRHRRMGRPSERAAGPGGQALCLDHRPPLAGDGLPNGVVRRCPGPSSLAVRQRAGSPSAQTDPFRRHQHGADALAAQSDLAYGRLAARRLPVAAGWSNRPAVCAAHHPITGNRRTHRTHPAGNHVAGL